MILRDIITLILTDNVRRLSPYTKPTNHKPPYLIYYLDNTGVYIDYHYLGHRGPLIAYELTAAQPTKIKITSKHMEMVYIDPNHHKLEKELLKQLKITTEKLHKELKIKPPYNMFKN